MLCAEVVNLPAGLQVNRSGKSEAAKLENRQYNGKCFRTDNANLAHSIRGEEEVNQWTLEAVKGVSQLRACLLEAVSRKVAIPLMSEPCQSSDRPSRLITSPELGRMTHDNDPRR